MNTINQPETPSIGIVVLGCDKNTADAERFAGMITTNPAGGITVRGVTPNPDAAPPLDAVVIYTCSFIHDAKAESVETILAWCLRRTETGNPRRIYVVGCLSEQHSKALQDEIPEVDGFFGLQDMDALASTLAPGADTAAEHDARTRLESTPYAFLKIADGCNHACTFCVIPSIKGPFRSRPREALLTEARTLVEGGAREVTLVAQDTTGYGRDLYDDYRLPQLLRDLCDIPGDFWIRCLYCYPGGITDALAEQLATQPKITPYLDIPLQHMAPNLLKAMKRPAPEQDVGALIAKLRAAIPNLALRTTMMVGFPGETEDDHQRMLDMVREIAFEWLGAFVFCPEEGTVAATLPNPVPETEAQARLDALMELQADITAQFNVRREGRRARVLVEHFDADLNAWSARSTAEAPEVDGAVLIHPHPTLCAGTFRDVVFVNASLYDITARVIDGQECAPL